MPEGVHDRGVCSPDGVVEGIGAMAPSVEDAENDGWNRCGMLQAGFVQKGSGTVAGSSGAGRDLAWGGGGAVLVRNCCHPSPECQAFDVDAVVGPI